jgi:hypothetical protein
MESQITVKKTEHPITNGRKAQLNLVIPLLLSSVPPRY